MDFAGQRVATGPCVDREGHPLAHTAYVTPARTNSLLGLSIAVAGLAASVLIILFFVGTPAGRAGPGLPLRTSLAPGPTSSRHSMATMDCAQCHRPAHNVEDVRCERCHDPALSARLTNAAHVFGATGDVRAAMAAPTVACAGCHVEHRGADANLADVDDRECGSCHRVAPGAWTKLTALDRHPEFAVVRAGVETGSGLRWFNHALHLTKVQQKFQKGCDGCHDRVGNAPAFEPVSFERHCAGCHDADLSESAGSLTTPMLTALGPIRPGVDVEPDPDEPGRQVLVGLTHADPWILQSVQSLRRTIHPGVQAAERLALDRQVAQLELVMRFAPDAPGGTAWLDASYPPAGAGGPPAVPPESALRELAAAVASLAAAFGADAEALAAEAGRLQALAPADPPPARTAATNVDALRRLIEATMARARSAENPELEQRARGLLERLDRFPEANRTPSVPDASSAGVEILLSELAALRDPASREEVREMTQLARMARHKAAGGIDPTAFDLHRQEVLLLLDAVRKSLLTQGTQRDPRVRALLARQDSLRRLVLATTYSLPPDVGTALGRALRARQAERTRLDLELQAAGMLLAAPPETHEAPRNVEHRLAQLRRQLQALAAARPLEGPLSAADARATIAALLGTVAPNAEANASRKNRCTMCHDLTADGSQLAPVRAVGESLMPGARFSHAPHVSGAADNCGSCHGAVTKSTLASDLNLPGVASCRTCHAAERQAARAAGCEACHTYHVPSFASLRGIP